MEAAATAQPRGKLTPTALTEPQRAEALQLPSADTSVSLLHPQRYSVWRLLQLPSADTSVS